MGLFDLNKLLDKDDKTRGESLMEEARSFDLAGTGGFLAIVKYLIFAILASLNFHLFYSHVPGIWGVALGSVALLFEACCVYFWNKQNKSAGAHKIALQAFAVLFTTISFVHGCAALYQISGVGPTLENTIYNYSKYVAFPLLFGLMVLAVCVLHAFHWSTAISESRAASLLAAERGRAQLVTQALELEHQSEIENSRLAYFEHKSVLEEKLVGAMENYIQIKERSRRAMDSVSDPELRQSLLNAMGRTSTSAPTQRRINPLPAAAQASDPKDNPPS
jgi:hypothetical protein